MVTLQTLPLPDGTWALVVGGDTIDIGRIADDLKAKTGARAILVFPLGVEVLPTPVAMGAEKSRGVAIDEVRALIGQDAPSTAPTDDSWLMMSDR